MSKLGHEHLSQLQIDASAIGCIEFDAETESLIIRNGKSRIVLGRDGTIRIEGREILTYTTGRTAFDAAYIDLN